MPRYEDILKAYEQYKPQRNAAGVYQPTSFEFARGLSSQLPSVGGISEQERAVYKTRRKKQLRLQEIDLVQKMLDEGAQFDEAGIEALSQMKPGEILQAAGSGPDESEIDPATAKVLNEKFGLQTSNKKLRYQIEALGGTAPEEEKGPSGLARVFDIISRPNFMMAEMADRMAEAEDKGDHVGGQLVAGFQGAGAGITGKEKTTFHDNLKEHGLPGVAPMKEGKPTGVLGFALDVGLDPTTYITFGASAAVKPALKGAVKAGAAKAGAKAAGKAGAKAAGKQIVEELGEDLLQEGGEKVFKTVADRAAQAEPVLNATSKAGKAQRRSIRELAIQDAKAFAAESGEKLSRKQLTEVGDKAVKEAEDAAALRTVDTATEAKRASEALAKRKEVQVKFVGKRVAGSEKLYKPIRVLGDTARATTIGNRLHHTFRSDAAVGGKIRSLERMHSNVSAAEFEDQLRRIQRAFSGSSKKDRIKITEAIESGSTNSIKGSAKLLDMHDEAKKLLDEIAGREVEVGALKQDELLDNYIYHVYKNKPKRWIGGATPDPKTGKYKTLADARAANAKPVEDITEILAHRLAKSHITVSKYGLYNDLVSRFAMDLRGKSARSGALRRLEQTGHLFPGSKISSIIPEGMYFDVEVADAIKNLENIFTKDENMKSWLKMFDTVQAKFKFAVTAPNPGFHVRNLMGDVFMNFLDGVVDPRVYDFAMKTLMSDTEIMGKAGVKPYKGMFRAGSHTIPADELKGLYHSQGLKSGFFHAETGLIPSPTRKVLSKASSGIRSASEFREDWTRMAHFIDAMKKEGSSKAGKKLSIDELAEKAAMRVKKYNFDYQDLTDIEKRFFRRAVPFYTYMRKNIPLQLESLFTRPGRVAVIPKGMRAMQEMIGEQQTEEPFPGLPEVVPDWIREFPAVQMQQASGGDPSVFLQPDFPVNQLQDFFGDFVDTEGNIDAAAGLKGIGFEMLGSASPVATFPAEYFSGHDLQTGAPVEGSFSEQLMKQIPALATLDIARNPTGDRTNQQIDVGGHQISERLLNYITGIGARVNTPQRQKSQLRKDEDVLRAILDALKAQQMADAGVPEGMR